MHTKLCILPLIKFYTLKLIFKKMKKLFYSSVLSLFMGTVMGQAPTNGLVAYYPFTGNASDASGNANNGTVVGATLTTDRNGVANSAYQFNNNYITVPNSASLQGVNPNLTFTSWVFIDSWEVFNGISYASILCKSNIGTAAQYRLSLTGTGFSLINNGQFLNNYSSGTTINSGQWVFVAATATATQTSLYINGNLVGTANYDMTFANNNTLPLEIGRDAAGATDYFHGKIDEVRIYNRVLSLCEIRQVGGFANTTPATLLPAITGNTSICVNQLTVLSNTTSGGVWSSSNPAVATVSALGVVTGVSPGSTVISYTVTSSGCSSAVSTTVTVNQTPTFVINGNTPVCPNTWSTYTISPVVAGARYYWVVDNNISMSHDNGTSTSVKVYFPDAPGTAYTVKAIAVDACGASAEVSKSVTINSNVPVKPVMTCSGTNCSTLSVNNPGAGVTIQWYLNGVLNTSLNGALSITRPQDTQIQVVFTKGTCSYSAYYFPAYCVGASMRLEDGQTSGMANYDAALKIYPNPNQGTFTFMTKGYKGRALVVNAIGSIVQEIELDETRTTYNISLNNLSKGTYMLKLTGGQEEHNGVFIIQ